MKKMNKRLKDKVPNFFAKLIGSIVALYFVWLANGLWHGPRWSYIFYGIYYFILITAGLVFEPLSAKILTKIGINRCSLKWVRTFILVNIGMLIFRAEGLKAGLLMFTNMFRNANIEVLWNGALLKVGLDIYDFGILLLGTIILIIISKLQEEGVEIRNSINKWSWGYRLLFYYSSIFSIIIFGAYGIGYRIVELIYAGF
jgi:D-alanyl-lipoteichoic acid acyltransferase DltB (MBOAT superfamily)